MKVRKLAVALALAGGLGSGVAQALGLGEIDLQSYLNEPLDADIELRKSAGVAPNEVFVNLAPESAYERVGIDRSYFLTKLNFQVTTAADGNLVVNVSSREPLREPYLNFLVEVTWPNGRLMREYAVLVDPPVYAEESGVQEQVAAPQTSQPSQTQQQTAPAQTTRQTTAGVSQSRSSGARTLGPTNSADTLWTIAAQIRPSDNVSMQQTMLAIQDLNPNAFIDGNINRLKRGEILRVPDENQIRSRSRAEANQEVAIQNRNFSTPARTVDASGTSDETSDGSAAGSTGGDQLQLVAADESGSRDSEEGGSAGGDSETAGGVDAGEAVAMEQLESARRENEELTGRVDDLQDQVETLQRLLELKNSQLAEMQSAETGDAAAETAQPADDGPTPADGSAAEPAESDEVVSEDEAMGEDAAAPEEGMGESAMEADAEMADAEPGAEAEMSDQGMADSEVAEEPADPAVDEPAQPAPQPEDAAPAEKPFPGNIIDAITNNFIYQLALGGGLIVLLLLLLLLARRNANREKAFYDQLNGESEADESDSFDLTLDEDEDVESSEDDPVAEADAYIAYGRYDQAAQTLETAISREPSRADLRLKLLGVYADNQDRDSFDKQFREIEAMDDEDATAEAQSIQARLEEAESMPSIDDLESQLRTGGGEQPGSESDESDDLTSDYDYDYADMDAEGSESEAPHEETSEADVDLEDMDLDLPDEEPSADLADEEPSEHEKPSEDEESRAEEDHTDDGAIEYDLSNLESGEDETAASGNEEESFDYSLEEGDLEQAEDESDDDLSIDFNTSEPESSDDEGDSELSLDLDEPDSAEDKPETGASDEKPVESAESDDVDFDVDSLDESFLDELDAELDKVADEDEPAGGDDSSELDDLELDVSDEDLALMEEFSEADDSDTDKPTDQSEEDVSIDDELGLEDALQGEEPADPEQEVEGAEEADEQLAGQTPSAPGDSEDDSDVPLASPKDSGDESDRDLDESDLGDDDDFDFLAGTDEAATKLDLARAYVEMGDVDGARDILEEVALEGNDEQKAEAQDLLKNLS